MKSERERRTKPLQAAIRVLMAVALALVMTPLPAYADAASAGGATGSGLTAASLGAQAMRNYAVFDSDTGTLTFRYGACAFANGQTDGTSTYYTLFDADRYVYALDVPWYGKRSSIKKVVFDNSARGHLKPASTAYWFCECTNLASVEGEDNLETSSTKNMASMFYNCSSLSSLDASGWKTASVTNMGGMFQGCLLLESLDLSGWDVSGVTSMDSMFKDCSSLANVTLGDTFSFKGSCELPTPSSESSYTGKWVNVSVPDAKPVKASDLHDNYPNEDETSYAPGTYVWDGSVNLAVLDEDAATLTFTRGPNAYTNGEVISEKIYYTGTLTAGFESTTSPNIKWDKKRSSIKKVVFDPVVKGALKPTLTSYWFVGCANLESVEGAENLDTSGVTNMREMFRDCSSLTFLDASEWDTSKVTDMGYMFQSCSSLASLDVSGWDTSSVKSSMVDLFYNCSSLAALDVSGWDVSSVPDMNGMFQGCSSLTSLDVSGWNISMVNNMGGMFKNCSSLASLDVSGWDTSKDTVMTGMFSGCSSLASLDVSRWNTSSVTSMDEMFSGCSELASLDVSGWNTSNVSHMGAMFESCSKLASLDVSGWKTSDVTSSMAYLFCNCSSLASLDLSGWDVSRVPRMSEMFSGCSSLSSLNLSGWDTSKVTSMGYLFFGCESLASVTLGDKFSFEGDGMTRCELPTPPDEGYTGKWINMSASGASPITAADLCDSYPNADDPSCVPGTYMWAPVLGPTESVDDSRCVYDGADQVPTVVLRGPDGEALVEGTDYRLELGDNVNAGEGWLRVVGLGLYAEQTIECAFTVHPRVAEFAWSGAISSAYDGTQKSVSVALSNAVTGDDVAAVAGGTARATNAGDYTATVTGLSGAKAANYTIAGSKTASLRWHVTKASIAKAKVTLAAKSYAYDGKAKKPAVKSVVLGGKKLKAGTDYAVSYKNNKELGTATATVTGKGSYKDSAKATFTIALAKAQKPVIVNAKAGTITVKWAKVQGAKKYQVRWRMGGGKWKTETVKSAKTTLKGLKAGKSYDVRVRAVSGKFTGAWSAQNHRKLTT